MTVSVYLTPLVISLVFYGFYTDLWYRSDDFNSGKNDKELTSKNDDFNYYDSCNSMLSDSIEMTTSSGTRRKQATGGQITIDEDETSGSELVNTKWT